MPRHRAGPRVLVVDDDEAIRGLISTALAEDGYEIVEAPGGEEALGILRRARKPFAVVILDIMMPGVDGHQVLARMTAEMNGGTRPPVIVITALGYEPSGLLREAIAGVADHLAKPFAIADLRRAIEAVLATPEPDLTRSLQAKTRAAAVYDAIDGLRARTIDLPDAEPTRARRRIFR